MELSAFAHMAQRNVKVVQPGLVYVIEWQAFAVSSSPTTPSLPDKEDLDGNDGDDPHSSIYVAYVPILFHFLSFFSSYLLGITIGNIFLLFVISRVPTWVSPESKNVPFLKRISHPRLSPNIINNVKG